MNITRGKVIKGAAVCIDVAAPLVATLSQFPVWVEKSSEATVSGLFLVFAFLSCIPFWKQIKQYIKSPSAIVVWAVFLVLFIAVRNIADEIIFVSMVGLASNLFGAGLYKLGGVLDKRSE